MPEFDSYRDFQKFGTYVKQTGRYIRDENMDRFLSTVIHTSTKRIVSYPKDAKFWRAQLGYQTVEHIISEGDEEIDRVEIEVGHPVERMCPLPDRAYEGRVNPKGIPCLYMSTQRETAMAEVRPWIDSYVSVGRFTLLKEVRVVDCSTPVPWRRPYYFKEPDADVREEAVWQAINHAFSEPVSRLDDLADYAPTQLLAESFRFAGYDGVAYGSKLGDGITVAIFDIQAAECIGTRLFRVKSLKFNFSEVASPYWSPGMED